MEMEGTGSREGLEWRRAGEGYEGHGSLSVASWTHLKGGC